MAEKLIDQLKSDFCSYYKFVKGEEYDWQAKDNTHMGQLIGKMGRRYPGEKSPFIRTCVRDYIKFCFHTAPQWYRDNLDVSIMNSKFNVLYTLMRKPINDPVAYVKQNEINYRNGNKLPNPAHQQEPANISDYISQFINEKKS